MVGRLHTTFLLLEKTGGIKYGIKYIKGYESNKIIIIIGIYHMGQRVRYMF